MPRNHPTSMKYRGTGFRASMRPRRVPRNHFIFSSSPSVGMTGFNEAEARASESPVTPGEEVVPGLWLQ